MELTEAIIKGIQEKKGKQITHIDLRGLDGVICNDFVLCTAGSPSQVDAIVDSIEEVARIEAGEKPVRIAGRENSVWVAMDYVDAMVHVFMPEEREYYRMEDLWQDAKVTDIPDID